MPAAGIAAAGATLAAVIFDMDGVLLDSEPLHHAVMNRVLAPEQVVVSEDAYREYIGTTDEDTWRDLVACHRLPHPQAHYQAAYDTAIQEAYAAHSVANPGVRELLAGLARRGLRLAVASSSRTAWVQSALARLGIREAFSEVVTGDMVRRGKPDPEIYLLAAARLGLAPAQCLAVEDAPKGVRAAHDAGMRVIGLRTPYTAHLALPGAALVLDSLANLEAALFGEAEAAQREPRP